MTKYRAAFKSFEEVCFANTTLSAVLGVPLDQWGEFTREPFLTGLKNITSEHMAAYRAEDIAPIERDDYWKLEL